MTTMSSIGGKPLALVAATVLAASAITYLVISQSGPEAPPAAESAAGAGQLSDAQVARLGIRLEPARAAGNLPLGTVPAVVSLPPEARVAVTSPFAGTIVRMFVIQGQDVVQGQPLAIVRAADTVRFGAELARAEADLEFSRASARRLDQLAKDGIVAGVRADEARAAVNRTEATIRENRRLLALGGAGRDGTMTLRAPISGRVSSVLVETGAMVGDAMAPFVVENTSALRLDLQLPARLAGQVRSGMTVDVVLPGEAGKGSPGMASGQVLSVGTSLDPASNSIAAKASLTGAAGLVPGKGVMVIVNGDGTSGKAGVAVPSQAVVKIGGQDYVFVRKGKTFERRSVTLAADAGGRAVISAGLKVGEPVAISGVAELKSLLAGQ